MERTNATVAAPADEPAAAYAVRRRIGSAMGTMFATWMLFGTPLVMVGWGTFGAGAAVCTAVLIALEWARQTASDEINKSV